MAGLLRVCMPWPEVAFYLPGTTMLCNIKVAVTKTLATSYSKWTLSGPPHTPSPPPPKAKCNCTLFLAMCSRPYRVL